MRRIVLAAAMTVAAVVFAPSTARAQTPAPDGAALYRQHCRSCHGARGTPPQRMVGVYPTLKAIGDSAFLKARSADSIVAVLRNGMGRDMKSFTGKLTPEEMAAVAVFVKGLASDSARAP